VATQQTERERLITAAGYVRWWPGALAFLVLGVLYALLPERLTVGPPWVPLIVVLLGLGGSRLSRLRGFMLVRRYIVLAALGIVSLAITVSAGFLIGALLERRTDAGSLLGSAAALWVSNILVFALLYWETDGGGPAHRHAAKRASTDFAFPQSVLAQSEVWMPEFVDYVFLAFNTSTAFSPTDTLVLARRAKALMMWQSVVSLVTIAVLAARAINTL
jgi:hypothetical protein